MEPVKCITDMVEYIQVSSDLISSLQKEATELKTQLVSNNIEKVASFSQDKVSSVVSKMVVAGFVKEAEASLAESRISADPTVILSMLEKLASDEISSRTKPIARSKSNVEDSEDSKKSDGIFNQLINKLSRIV